MSGRETYTQQGNKAFEAVLEQRTARRDAAFFLPHLVPGMHMLDAGCGPGSITLGLARHVAPGEVVGIDLQASTVERANALAAEQKVHNVRFEVGDVYQLPFEDASFDAAFANHVLMHLREPIRALSEIRRVLRRGGVLGVRDADLASGFRFPPPTPSLQLYGRLRRQVWERNGVDIEAGRKHRRMLLDAGFVGADAGASVDTAGSLETSERRKAFLRAQVAGIARTAIREGWADQATFDTIVQDMEGWAAQPDAFSATVVCETVGWLAS